MSEKITSPKARLAFANTLFEARSAKGNGTKKFGCSLIFEEDARKSPEYAKLRAAITEAGRAERKHWDGTKFDELVKAKKIRIPLLNGNDSVSAKTGEVYDGFAGNTFIRPTSKLQPGIVDGRLQPILEPKDLYSGCYVRATLGIFTYEAEGNRGVSFGLRNVQKLADGPALAGGASRAEDDFTPVDSVAGTETGFEGADDLPY